MKGATPMTKPNISNHFTLEDIHKIREYNHETTKDMTFDERKAYYEQGAADVLSKIAQIKANKKNSA